MSAQASRISTGVLDIPVVLSTANFFEAFIREYIQNHIITWTILSRAIANNGDHDALNHVTSPDAGWRVLVVICIASTLGTNVQYLRPLTSRGIKPGAYIITISTAMAKTDSNMRTNGSDTEGEVGRLLLFPAITARCIQRTGAGARTRERENLNVLYYYRDFGSVGRAAVGAGHCSMSRTVE